jgi:ketosteroid isomerase-like protein
MGVELVIDPKYVALKFNERINAQDIDGLVSLMTDDHKFIDIPGKITIGREKMMEGWTKFFDSYPDYMNIFSRVESHDNLVLMIGHSECSYDPLDGPVIWTAYIDNGLVAEWRVYEDNKKIRQKLGIE